MNQEEGFRKWVRNELETVPYPARFELALLSIEGMRESLRQLKTNGASPHPEEATRIADDLWEYARQTTKSMTHTVLFCVFPIIKTSRGEEERPETEAEGAPRKAKVSRRGQFRFNMRGLAKDVGGPNSGIAESEPPTPTGLMSQLMKHNEAVMRQNADLIEDSNGLLRQMLTDTSRELMAYRAREREMREQTEAILSESQERAMRRDEHDRKQNRLDMMHSTLNTQLGPVIGAVAREHVPRVLEMVTGSGAAPTPEAERFVKLRDVFLKADQETKDKVFDAMPAEMQHELLALLGG